ncbi:MAG TPA: XamI family restriction endonuclease [Phycisphaerae bacterium]|nr:XamI family restriction endonuclease [Phycisphaerae bacterium]
MPINADKPQCWKADIAKSVDFYNDWFLRFAPKAYRQTRQKTTVRVKAALKWTRNLRDISSKLLCSHPEVLQMLRMATAPPIARDRLIGLARVSQNLVSSMEDHGKVPPRMAKEKVERELASIGAMVSRLADVDIFPWLGSKKKPTGTEVYRAATIVADRLCGAITNPIIRNAQEKRQLAAIKRWLQARGYAFIPTGQKLKLAEMKPGSFAFHLNVPVTLGVNRQINIPVDAVAKPRKATQKNLPLLVEAKSAGDFTNVNKRRKEEATKITQLRRTYGDDVRYILFLCGYFDSGYLGYEAAEGLDWVWEHRIDDLSEFGL